MSGALLMQVDCVSADLFWEEGSCQPHTERKKSDVEPRSVDVWPAYIFPTQWECQKFEENFDMTQGYELIREM